MFSSGQVIVINNEKFTIRKVYELLPGIFELTGTRENDPLFLAGKRTVFSSYLTKTKCGYKYDWNAK